jgi:hypothetical protein
LDLVRELVRFLKDYYLPKQKRRKMKKQKGKIKKVMKALNKASKAHAGQAKILKGVLSGRSKKRNG